MVDRRRHKSKADQEESLSLLFGALSDPSRRHIVELLRESGELKVGDLAAAFDMSFNGVSKHLKVLEKAGLVQRRVNGREHWLSVSWPALQPGYEWLHAYQRHWTTRIDALVDYVSRNKTRKKR